LHFRAAILRHGKRIPGHQGSIQGCGNPIAGIAAPHRCVTVDDTQTRYRLARLILGFRVCPGTLLERGLLRELLLRELRRLLLAEQDRRGSQ
jgi:hypothetical protein